MNKNSKRKLILEAAELVREYEIKNEILMGILKEEGINSRTISKCLSEGVEISKTKKSMINEIATLSANYRIKQEVIAEILKEAGITKEDILKEF